MSTWWKRIRTIRDAPSYAEGLAFGAACIAFVLLVWWLLTLGEGDARIVDAYTLPSPSETFKSFPDLWKRELSRSILISLVRVLGGFLLAAAIGVPAGSYPRVNAFYKPLVIFGRSIPIAGRDRGIVGHVAAELFEAFEMRFRIFVSDQQVHDWQGNRLRVKAVERAIGRAGQNPPKP